MEVLGEGITSCVVKTPLDCKVGDTTKDEKYVGKILPKSLALSEIQDAKIVRKVDPRSLFSSPVKRLCKPLKPSSQIRRELEEEGCTPVAFQKQEEEPLYQIFIENRGIPLSEMTETTMVDMVKFQSSKIAYTITETMRLLYGAAMFRKHKLSHFDIHSNNVLIDLTTSRLTIIDYGKLVDDVRLYDQFKQVSFVPKAYYQYPPECVFLSEFLKTKEGLRAGLAIQSLPKPLLFMLQHGAETGHGKGPVLYELRKSKMFQTIASIFESADTEERFSYRCKGLMIVYEFMKGAEDVRKRFEEMLQYCFITIDSYAIGKILKKLVSLMHPQIGKSVCFTEIVKVADALTKHSLRSRISAVEGIRRLYNCYRVLKKKETRNNVQKNELFREIQNLLFT